MRIPNAYCFLISFFVTGSPTSWNIFVESAQGSSHLLKTSKLHDEAIVMPSYKARINTFSEEAGEEGCILVLNCDGVLPYHAGPIYHCKSPSTYIVLDNYQQRAEWVMGDQAVVLP